MDVLTPAVLDYLRFVEVLAIAVALVTALSSADDIFIDVYYWCLRLLGGQSAKDRVLAKTVQETTRLPERPFAIMVPAWREHDVIYAMVATNSRLLTYRNYHYFIGVYRNDAATVAEARRVQRDCPNVHIVVVPRDGPTSKADCLNVILHGILDYEAEIGAHLVAGYDSKAGTRWAAGLGPSVLSYIWLGGDKYRSYDAVLTLQVGYIFNVGPDKRQSGWRAQIGVTF